MDWRYEHFNQEAVFNAPIRSVLEAARAVASGTNEQIEETADGFIARGRSGWHATTATFRAASVPNGTQLRVELLVERYSLWGYMLFDPFGFYGAQIDRWFSDIAQRLDPAGQQALVSKSTMSYRIQRGCLAGCLVWLVAVACLGVAGAAADAALFPQSSNSTPGPFSPVASLVALLAGVLTFLYVRFPEGPVANFIRSQLGRKQGSGEK